MNLTDVIASLEAEIAELDTRRAALVDACDTLVALQGPSGPKTTTKAATAVRQARPTTATRPSQPRAKILAHLQTPMSTAELATAVSMKPATVLFHLKKMKDQGQVRASGKASRTRYERA